MANEQYEETITGFPLFQGYTRDGARMLLESGKVLELPSGQLLFAEGDPANCVLLVLAGKLEVFVRRQGRDLRLTEVGPGTILGEIAVLCGIPRSASVRTLDSSAVLELNNSSFRSLLLRNNFLSERIFRQSLRTLIEKEQSLIESLVSSESR